MRIIIDNRAGVDEDRALHYVHQAISCGIISLCAEFGVASHRALNGVYVQVRRNKTGHKFVVYREEPQNAE